MRDRSEFSGIRRLFAVVSLSFVLVSGQAFAQALSAILLIGDGMGSEQVKAASLRIHDRDGRLAMQVMPIKGSVSTHSANAEVTDSAASGTALACGHKTDNGMIGVTPSGKILRSILEACRDAGKGTGLVATSTITHATPASFAAHIPDRGQQAAIAVQMTGARVNVMLGGGLGYFTPQDTEGSSRKDDRDLWGELGEAGYETVTDEPGLERVKGDLVAGLFAMGALDTAGDGPGLSTMTAKAIGLLSDREEGFFLMVEGSQIDWACHGNDEEYFMREMVAFDAAVSVALEYAARQGNVLVVVTADHETGGMHVSGKKSKKMRITWTTKGHTAADVPVFAMGPGSRAFRGRHDNTDIPKLIANGLGLERFW